MDCFPIKATKKQKKKKKKKKGIRLNSFFLPEQHRNRGICYLERDKTETKTKAIKRKSNPIQSNPCRPSSSVFPALNPIQGAFFCRVSMSPGELRRSMGTHSVGHSVSEGLLHPHGADADVDVKAYPASAEETAIPSFPYREESVSYKVVVEGGVSAMATNAFDDEPEIVKEALPSQIEKESHTEVSSIRTNDESEMVKESPLSVTETEFLAEVCGSNNMLIKVNDSCEKESLTEGNYLFKGEEENAKTSLIDGQDSLPMVADRVKTTTVEEEQSPLVGPPAQEDFVIGEPVRAISEVVLDGDVKDSEMQITRSEGYPGGEGIVIKANQDQEDNPKENPSMLMGISEGDKSPESTPAERFMSAQVIMLGNGNNQNSVIASEAIIDMKEAVIEKPQLAAKLVVASGVDQEAEEVDSKSLMSEEIIMPKRLPVEEPKSLRVPENTGKTDSRSIETVEESHKVKGASNAASDTLLFDEDAKEIKNPSVGEGPSTELKRMLSVGEASHKAFDFNHADEVQNDVQQVVAVTSSDIPYLSGTICTENESECEESTLDQEEMISLHVEEHPHGCVTYENEDKYIQSVKDGNHILQKEQDYCKVNGDVSEKENINIGMKLPLLVTGVAIAAIGVAVASLSKCR